MGNNPSPQPTISARNHANNPDRICTGALYERFKTDDNQGMIRLSAYPWHSLDRVPRDGLRLVRDGRIALGTTGLMQALEKAAEDYLAPDPVRITVQGTRHGPIAPSVITENVICLFANPPQTLIALVVVEPELAHRIVSTVLMRPILWINRSQPIPSMLHAAFGAFVLSCLRTAVADVGFQLLSVGPSAQASFAALHQPFGILDTTVTLARAAYGASVWWHTKARPTAGTLPFGRKQLLSMGNIPLSLEIVAAMSTISRGQLASLGRGDAWLPADGWTVRYREARLEGEVLLMSPHATIGWSGQLRHDGTIELGARKVQEMNEQQATTPSPNSLDTMEALADVPVVVRVEVGTLTLTAREWASVQPGDVITTGRSLGQPICLRVGGIEVARGELVDVEGELGVRIHELMTPKDGAA